MDNGNGCVRDGHGDTDKGVLVQRRQCRGVPMVQQTQRTECKALCSLETSRSEPDLTWL